ncbi:Dhh family domain protein, putative [Candidatus Vecturithrix granuli]|uniref:Dhh family domain protein, putative n=1 Tax=Vecturithrix granuli TaxID=1499967 RepID=A0A081C600_VECG1|nr:Dhh family domain protein, putative [Candidatus Vecturithrix granuli]
MNSDQILYDIKHAIHAASSILITGQDVPDGDSLGSELALYDMLWQQKRHDKTAQGVEIVIANDAMPPAHYGFFPHVDIITPCETIQARQFQVGFVLDTGTDRIGAVLPVLKKCRAIITIDHHQSRAQGIEQISWIDPAICSVAEMLYDFFEHPGWNLTLTPDIAACLYGGMIYDTGSFRYPNTTAKTLRIAAKLLETGFDFSAVAERLFLEKPYSSLQLLSAVLHTLQRDETGQIIWGVVTQDMLKQAQADIEETDGIITHYAFTQGVKVAILFKETSEHEIKISFRARGAIDVGKFAKALTPKGGGHHRAAGCTLHGSLEQVQELVLQALQQVVTRKGVYGAKNVIVA